MGRLVGSAASGRWLLGRGSGYATVTAAQAVAMALTLPVLARLLAPSELGVIAACLIVYRIVALLGGVGLPAAVGRDYFEGDGPRRAGILATWSICLVGLVTLLVDATGPAWASMFEDIPYAEPLRLAVWTGAATAVARTGLGYLRSADRARAFIAISIIGGPIAHVAGLGLVALVRPDPVTFLWGFFAAALLGAVVAVTLIPTPRPRPEHVRLVRAGIRYGLPTVPHLGAMMVVVLGDRVLVERILGVDQLGRYEVAYVLGAIGIQLLLAVSNAWAPMVFGADEGRRWSLLSDTTDLLHRLSRWTAAGIAVGAPIGLVVVAPGSYDPIGLAPVVAVVAGAMPFYVWYAANSIVVQQCRRTAIFYWAAPLAAVLNLTLNAILLPFMGLIGAAAATVVAYGFLGLLLAWAARRHASVPWRPGSLRDSVVIVGVAVLASSAAPSSAEWMWVRGLAAAAILASLLLIVRSAVRPALEKED